MSQHKQNTTKQKDQRNQMDQISSNEMDQSTSQTSKLLESNDQSGSELSTNKSDQLNITKSTNSISSGECTVIRAHDSIGTAQQTPDDATISDEILTNKSDQLNITKSTNSISSGECTVIRAHDSIGITQQTPDETTTSNENDIPFVLTSYINNLYNLNQLYDQVLEESQKEDYNFISDQFESTKEDNNTYVLNVMKKSIDKFHVEPLLNRSECLVLLKKFDYICENIDSKIEQTRSHIKAFNINSLK